MRCHACALSLFALSIFINHLGHAVKVLHDCRRDAEALFYQLGVDLTCVLDTQVLYGMYVTTKQLWQRADADESDMRRIGLNRLLEFAGLSTNAHKDAMHRHMQADELFWKRRYADIIICPSVCVCEFFVRMFACYSYTCVAVYGYYINS